MGKISLNDIINDCSEKFTAYTNEGIRQLAENPREYLTGLLFEDDGICAFGAGALITIDDSQIFKIIGIGGFFMLSSINKYRPDKISRNLRNFGYALSGSLFYSYLETKEILAGLMSLSFTGLSYSAYNLKDIYSGKK